MENAVDALKMAAAVLTFVMALGISISTLSQAKQTAQVLINYTDREYETQYVEDTGERVRIVGKETIVPTIYRAYKENYKILFYDRNGNPITLYTKKEKATYVNVNYIDLKKEVLGDDRQKDNFIIALLYGNKAEGLKNSNGEGITFDEFKQELQQNNSQINLNSEGIYDTILNDSTFIEKFGVYYDEDYNENLNLDTDISDEYEETVTPDINKMKKRVISYYQQ